MEIVLGWSYSKRIFAGLLHVEIAGGAAAVRADLHEVADHGLHRGQIRADLRGFGFLLGVEADEQSAGGTLARIGNDRVGRRGLFRRGGLRSIRFRRGLSAWRGVEPGRRHNQCGNERSRNPSGSTEAGAASAIRAPGVWLTGQGFIQCCFSLLCAKRLLWRFRGLWPAEIRTDSPLLRSGFHVFRRDWPGRRCLPVPFAPSARRRGCSRSAGGAGCSWSKPCGRA